LLLLLFKVPYKTYMIGGDWINLFLGPAVVALAIPLYKQRELLKQNLLPIIAGVLTGVVVGMVSGKLKKTCNQSPRKKKPNTSITCKNVFK